MIVDQFAPSTAIGPGLFDVTIGKPGLFDPRKMFATGISWNKQITRSGDFTCRLSTASVVNYLGKGVSLAKLRGDWLTYEHPTAGRWSGVIVDAEPLTDANLVSITARTWHELLAKINTPKMFKPATGTAGTLAMRLIREATYRNAFIGITDMQVDETGEALAISTRGESILQALRRLESDSGQEWTIDDDRKLIWRDAIGNDQSRTYELVQGIHIASIRPTYSLDPVASAILAVPADDQYERNRSQYIEDAETIADVGLREERIVFAGAVTRSTIVPIARKRLQKKRKAGQFFRMEVVDVDDCWSWFRAGDTIRIVHPSANVTYVGRVMVRSLDLDRGVMTCSGSIEKS